MKIIFFGTPDFVIPVLDTLFKHHDVIAIVTSPDHFDSKKNKIIPSPIKTFYQHYYETHSDLNRIYPLRIDTPENKTAIKNLHLENFQPDLFVIAAYGKIIPEEILAIPSLGALNIHPSLLPKYRGTSPVQTALLNGDKVTGVSIIKMDAQMDHGPVLASQSEPIFETDTFVSLVKRLFEKAADMLPEVIQEYATGTISLIPQDESQATLTRIIIKDDGYLDLSPQTLVRRREEGAEQNDLKLEITRKIRAYFPWPGAWTKVTLNHREIRIKFLPATSLHIHNREESIPTDLSTPFLIQPEGKKPMSIKDFLNGYPELKENMNMWR